MKDDVIGRQWTCRGVFSSYLDSMKQQLIAISGPSCGGKTTLKSTLLAKGGGRLVEVVTTTTRAARPGEQEEGAYRFCSTNDFAALIANDQLLEWVEYGGHCYGIERASLNGFHDSGKSGVVVVTEDGARALAAWCERNGVELVRVLATAPTDELLRRLAARVDVDEATVQWRREQLLARQSQSTDLSVYDWIVESKASDCVAGAQ